MEVNHNPMYKRGIKILVRGGFGFRNTEFFIPILILKNNSNTLINENGIGFSFPFSIPTFQTSS